MPVWMKRVGWVIVGFVTTLVGFQLYEFYQAAEQQHASYNYQPAEKRGFRISSATHAPTPEYKPSCNNPDGREDADLCAQWAAVDQVAESNRLNSVNLRILVLTLFLTIIGTGSLVWTLLDTRRTSRAELRAYLFVQGAIVVDGTSAEIRGNREYVPSCLVEVKNFGNTPAHNVRVWAAVILVPTNVNVEPPAPDMSQCGGFSVFPPQGGSTYARSLVDDPMEPENWFCLSDKDKVAIAEGRAGIMLYGRITYRDVFDTERTTNFRLQYTGSWPPPEPDKVRMQVCSLGNESD